MTIAQKSYDIQPGNDLNDTTISFVPLAVLVDNYSPYWLLLPDAGRYVPPFTSGVSLPLIHATSNRAQWQNPPLSGLSTQSYVETAGFVHLTFVAEPMVYSAGSSVPNSVLSQQQSFSAAEGSPIIVTLDFLAQGVRIDNPGGTAYTIVGTSLIIPPWTTAWVANFTTPFNTITIQAIANPNGTPNTTQGGPIVATFYAQQLTTSGGTPYTQPQSIPNYIQSASAGGSGTGVTVNLPAPPTAGNLLIAAMAWANNTSHQGPIPTGFTQLFFSSAGTTGLWIGYKISDGSEQSLTFTGTFTQYSIAAIVGEYGAYTNGIFQTAIASATNTASATPVTIPSLAIGVNGCASTTTNPGTPSSTNVKIDAHLEVNAATTYWAAVAIGHLYYTTAGTETATITRTTIAIETAIILGQ